jgi:hypothetical protein
MSSTIATRTTRFTPPAVPTRKGSSRRTVSGPGASVVGLSDRPVLRIVADDERAPVVTRVLPPVSSVSLPSSVEPVETRRIDLADFFAAEYDGDDPRLEVAAPRRSTVRLTHRGRLFVLGLGLAATLGLGFYAASVSVATDHAEQTHVVTVQPGQTLWDLAAGAAHGGDVRAMMSHLETINHLDSTALQAGQHLRIPR